MVNRGRSHGCNTCRARRVKCDEAKPSCHACTKTGRECGGYEREPRRLRFQAVKFDKLPSSASSSDVANDAAATPCHQQLGPKLPDTAVCFFMNTFVLTGRRDLSSHRGFFAVIQPIMRHDSPSSATSLAITALSIQMFMAWNRGWKNAGSSSALYLCQALLQLQKDIDDPLKSGLDSTLLATLILQFNENIAAVQRSDSNTNNRSARTHNDGAVALLRHRGKSIKHSPYGGYLLGHVLHTKVSNAIRDKQSLPGALLDWLVHEALPPTPSSTLDQIGISVANIQHDFHSACTFPRNHDKTLYAEACSIEARLQAWAGLLPKSWLPHRFSLSHHAQEKGDDVPTYHGLCDIYPSIQIATIWNLWRCYRLIILQIRLSPLQRTAGDALLVKDVQHTVHALCASVPFFLGNWVSSAASAANIPESDLYLPSYHHVDASDIPQAVLLSAGEEALALPTQGEHRRSVMSQGPWHLMGPLRHLLSLCADGVLASCLQGEEMAWVRAQLVRGATAMRLVKGGVAW